MPGSCLQLNGDGWFFLLLSSPCYAKQKTELTVCVQSGFLNTAPFDPVGLRSEEMREKEVKNARLAMVAFLGFTSQTAITGLGPIACLKKHLEDPGHNNSTLPLPLTLFPRFIGTSPRLCLMSSVHAHLP